MKLRAFGEVGARGKELYEWIDAVKFVLFIASLVLFTENAWGDALSAGKSAWARGDYAAAAKSLQPLADRGNPEAQFSLGRMHSWGHGVKKNKVEAIFWFRMAARQGHPEAQAILAERYIRGKNGVPQDYALAAKWYQKAAEQGHIGAQYGLGKLYAEGKGVRRNYVAAHMWFNLAAASGHSAAATNRSLVSQKLKPDEIAKAQKLARNWTTDSDKN